MAIARGMGVRAEAEQQQHRPASLAPTLTSHYGTNFAGALAMSTTPDTNTWIVGLDLGERSLGALHFAHWLAGQNDRTVGVHVLESWSRSYLRGEPAAAVREAVAHATREAQIAPPSSVETIEAGRAEDGLAQAAAGSAGLVIGRATRASERGFNRLGHVARRLLRELPAPVIVVPPDLFTVSAGPILLATDLDVATTPAVQFAVQFAADHGRELEVVHVGMPRHSDLIDELEPAWVAARDQYRAQVTRSLQAWVETHGLGGSRHHIVYGNTVEGIEAVAVGCNAAMIVVGSRRLGAAGRVFLGSTASALAGFSTFPVAVVPSR